MNHDNVIGLGGISAWTRLPNHPKTTETTRPNFSFTLYMNLESTKSGSAGRFGLSHLPPEIITEIFLNVCDRNPSSKPLFVAGSTKKTPLVYPFFLGKICRWWREMAWTCPILWSVIHIPVSLRKYEQQLDLLKEWIERTSTCPLSIYLEVHDGEGLWRGTDFLRGLFSLLVAESFRWDTIEFFLPKHSKGVLNDACLRVPLLRSATIRALRSDDVELEFLKSAPRLTNINLVSLSPKGVDCVNLTHLTATCMSFDDIMVMLQNAPALEHCGLQNTYRGPDPEVITEFPLPSLRSLYLRESHSARFFPHISRAPKLHHLELSDFNGEFSLEVISSFLGRAESTLRSLAIGGTLDPKDLYTLCERIKSVSSLEIQHCYSRGESEVLSVFLDGLDPDTSQASINNEENEAGSGPRNKENPLFLPNLRKLGYQMPVKTADDQLERFCRIVQRRWRDGKTDYNDNLENGGHSPGDFARLEVLQFDPFFAASEHMTTLLQIEIEEGLRITFNLPSVCSEDEDP